MKLLINIVFITLLLTNQSIAATIIFREKFIELATNDSVLDKLEYQYLKKLSLDTGLHDKAFADDTLKNLANYKDRTKLEYTLQKGFYQEQVISFVFAPTYTETEKIPGNNVFDIISNISQKDSLAETLSDDDRCAAASFVNSYLLMGGSFSKLAGKFSISNQLTYKNVHLIQEKVYNIANSDNSPGLYSGYKYKSYSDGKIFAVEPSGEVIKAANALNIKLSPIVGNTLPTIHKRKKQVESFFKNNPNGVIQVGIYLDLKNGGLKAPYSDNEQNHVVTIFKRNNRYYMDDTSSVNNGDGKNLFLLSNNQMEYFVYNTSAIIMGLTMN